MFHLAAVICLGDHVAVIAQLDGDRINALELAAHDWASLKASEHRKRLTMPLCGTRAVAKNLDATQFFSHLSVGECGVDHGGESAQHQAMKEAIAHAVNLVPGWRAEIEHPHPSRTWIIDVMATSDDGRRRYAFEVQLSSQPPEEYYRRTQQYFDSRYMPVWLIPRDLRQGEVRIPTLTTGFGKTSEIPNPAAALLRTSVTSSVFDLSANTLGSVLYELLMRGHRWRYGSPNRQAELLKEQRERIALERKEAEERRAEFQAAIESMNRRTATAEDAFGRHVIETDDDLYVRAAVTECWHRLCRQPMLIWHAWTPRGHRTRTSTAPDVQSEVGLKRLENHPKVHRVIDRWMTAVDCDVEKATIDLRRTKAKGSTYSAFVCPTCDSVCGQAFISHLERSKWSVIGSPKPG